MKILTPTAVIEVTRSQNNPSKVNQAMRRRTIECLGYKVNATKVKRRIWLMFLIRNISRIHFLTITFPEGLPDNTVFWLLNTFFTNMKHQGYFKNYIWVSERQKNGTIHFHIFITQYTPAENIQSAISSSLTTAYKKGISTYPPAQCANYQGFFFSKNRHGKVINLKNLKSDKRKLVASYCAKYVSKDEDLTDLMPILHRRSGCSKSIGRILLSIEVMRTEEDTCYRYIERHSEIRGKKFIEQGYTIWIMQRIPPQECILFWVYIELNEHIYAQNQATPTPRRPQ